MRNPVIAGNWKLNKKLDEAMKFVSRLTALIEGVKDVEVVIAPPFTVIGSMREALTGTGISLSGQDCFWEEEGAFTGEVSPGMLKDVGCSHVIIGHSERRQFFGETDASVARKTKAALKTGLTAIICIGETLEERELGKTFHILGHQIESGLESLTAEDLNNVILAYEPVWAIGTGKTATDDQAQEAHSFIRGRIENLFSKEVANDLRILYGGSVKAENICGLMQQPDIDGALVGGASLSADIFASIIKYKK